MPHSMTELVPSLRDSNIKRSVPRHLRPALRSGLAACRAILAASATRTRVAVRCATGIYHLTEWRLETRNRKRKPETINYIPGNFIPASLREKLALPMSLNIFFICTYWRSS